MLIPGLSSPRAVDLNGDLNTDLIMVQSDGKVVIGGAFSSVHGTARGRIARLNSDGSLGNMAWAAGVLTVVMRSSNSDSDSTPKPMGVICPV